MKRRNNIHLTKHEYLRQQDACDIKTDDTVIICNTPRTDEEIARYIYNWTRKKRNAIGQVGKVGNIHSDGINVYLKTDPLDQFHNGNIVRMYPYFMLKKI